MSEEPSTKTCTKCGNDLPLDEEHFNKAGIRRGKQQYKAVCRTCRYQGKYPPPIEPVPEGFEVRGVSTGLDADGTTEKQWIEAKPERPVDTEIIDPLQPGHKWARVSTLTSGDGKVIQQWKIATKESEDKQKRYDAILEAIRGIADDWPPRLAVPAPDYTDEDTLCIYPMGDPHFGMYSWAAETGNDYDLELAEQYHVAAMEALVAASPPAKHALVIDLGDFFHMDNSSNMTPRSGHVLDVDTRRPKVFRAGARSFRKLIDLTQTKHEHTDVWVVPGNHDADSSTPLQVALEMLYEGNPRVYIDPSPAIALYKRFGDNLIGSTHTHTVRDKQTLGEMMACQRPKEWGDTCHRYWYCGHVHHDSLTETRGGVIVETFRTLAAKDKYAADNFYDAGRDMKCDVLHRVDGRIQRNVIGIRQIRRMLGMPGPV